MMDKYVHVKQIGRGSFGKCILVQRKPDKKLFVLKEVNVQEMTPGERKEAMNEVNVLSVLRHPNIIAYHESFVSEGVLNIVMEYAEVTNDKTRVFFSETEIMDWFCQISLALQYTHQKNILHRDLKTQNIFLTSTKTVKLGDFGIAKVLNSDTEFAKTIIGTPYYLSPEMCEDQPYDSKSDIWALGCVLYEMATLRHAFDAHNLPALVLKILKGDYPPIPQVYSKDLANLVKSMLRTDPRERPSIAEILTTSLVQKYLVAKPRTPAPRAGVPIPRKPPTPAESSKKSSPEKLQILKLRNEPKAKSKENVKKVLNSTSASSGSPHTPSPGSKARVPAKSLAKSPSLPGTPRSRTPNLASASPRTPSSALASPRTPNPAFASPRTPNPAVASPRSRTPPVSTPPLTPRSQQNSPRPYSSPAISHRSNNPPHKDTHDTAYVPTPRPSVVTPVQEKKTHQRAKSEPLKRSVPVTAGLRKPSIPSTPSPSAPPKPPPLIAKKRTPLKLELKQHEQKFKDNLKSVKARIARDNKPFQNAIKPDEPLSPTSAASSQLLFIIPPTSPPTNGTVSAPVTPRRTPAQPVRTRTVTSARSPAPASNAANGPASPASNASPASSASHASGASPAHASRARAHSLHSTTGAAALKEAASTQALMRKQKSFTAKTETLKEVIKKSRRQIKKGGAGGDDVSVEIVVPKHMEHLLNMEETDAPVLETGAPKEESCEPKKENGEPKEENEGKEDAEDVAKEEREGEGEKGDEEEKESDIGTEKEEEGKEEGEGKEGEKEREKEGEGEKEREGEGGKEGKGEKEESVNKEESITEQTKEENTPRINGRDVRFSTDFSQKMDKLSIRIETLRQKCEQVFGEDTFFKVYKFLREMKQDADDKEIQNTLHKMVGNEKLAYLRYVDQLIFCELQFYGS